MNKKTMQIIVVLMLPALAFAQTANSKKKVTLGDLLKKAADESRGAKATTQAEKKSVVVPDSTMVFEEKKDINLNSVKPPKLSEMYKYDNVDEAKYEKTLNLQIGELYKLTQKFKNSGNRGELWLRLAELYLEKANIIDRRKQDEFDLKLREFQAGKSKVKPVLDVVDAKDFNRKSIQLYEWFIKDFPNDPKLSQALFFLGYNNFELGNGQLGSQYYDQLTTKFPKSQYAGEAHFAIGEGYFEKEAWSKAYTEYSFLIKENTHNLHTIAMYKAAWCLFRVGKTEEGIKYLDYIIKSSRFAKQSGTTGGRKINMARLENESIKDLVVFFADLGDTKRALTYFRTLNTKESKDAIEKLAYYYSNKGNNVESREVFKYLIAQEPNSKKAFEYQYQIVQNYFVTKNSPEFKLELYRWIINYNAKSAWHAANKGDEAFLNKSIQLREQTLRNYILQQHQTAQNSRAAYSRQSSDEGYKLYFQEFSTSPQVGDMHFFYGELLYDMGQFPEAAIEYTAVVNGSPNNQYAERASQNILLAIEKSLPKDEDLQKRVGNSIEPMQMDDKVSKFITTGLWYLGKYPKAERAPEIKFRIGRLSYLSNNFDPAEKQFKEIVQQYPKTKFSEYSANLLLDIYNLKNDFAGLEKIGAELLADPSIANGKIGAEIRGVIEKASFKRGQNFELEKKYLESAMQFQAFAVQYPKSELMGISFFNAAVNFERAGRNREAIVNYKKVLETNSPSVAELKPKSKRLLAKLLQDSGFFAESGRLYSELAKDNPKDPLYDNYLFNAALMLEITGKTTEAIAGYRNYMKVSKSKGENAAIQLKIATMQRQASRSREAVDSYKSYIEMPGVSAENKIESVYWVHQLSTKRDSKSDIEATEQRIRGLLGNVPAAKKQGSNAYLAKLKLKMAVELFHRLKEIPIPADPKKQKAAVGKKLESMSVLNQQLGIIIKLDSAEEIVSALDILGESNEHMALSFSSVPVPGNLNADQKKLYLAEIEKITLPFTNKSEESYKLAVERGMDLQIYNEAYANSFRKLSKKYPQKYYASGEVPNDSQAIDWVGDK